MSHLYCECCNFQAVRPAEFKRHLQTKKHNTRIKKSQNNTNSYPSQNAQTNKIICKHCHKEFAFRSGLSRHLKYHCKHGEHRDSQYEIKVLQNEIEQLKMTNTLILKKLDDLNKKFDSIL